jgi:hypothetical protein
MDEILNCFLDHAGRFLENNLLADPDPKMNLKRQNGNLIELMVEHSQMQF